MCNDKMTKGVRHYLKYDALPYAQYIKQVEDGTKYIPDIPVYDEPLTVRRQRWQHTSVQTLDRTLAPIIADRRIAAQLRATGRLVVDRSKQRRAEEALCQWRHDMSNPNPPIQLTPGVINPEVKKLPRFAEPTLDIRRMVDGLSQTPDSYLRHRSGTSVSPWELEQLCLTRQFQSGL